MTVCDLDSCSLMVNINIRPVYQTMQGSTDDLSATHNTTVIVFIRNGQVKQA